MKFALAQINPIVGDFEGNRRLILEYYERAISAELDLVIFPEFALIGYPPEDLILRQGFIEKADAALKSIVEASRNKDTAIILGSVHQNDHGRYNAAYVIADGDVIDIHHKTHLPNYGVFDEKRHFTAGELPHLTKIADTKIAVLICEDLWYQSPIDELSAEEPDLIISIHASPFHVEKIQQREACARRHFEHVKIPLIYVNQLGGQDELVFDGHSFALSKDGLFPTVGWQENLHQFQLKKDSLIALTAQPREAITDVNEQIYQALVLGVRDYVHKNGFPGVLIGMSGGIDSALSALIAVDALGAENVRLIMMPSQFTSKESLADAQQCADNLGVPLENIPITPIVEAFHKGLEQQFKDLAPDTTEENIQSRIRGALLMAMSNKSGFMVLTTGNKSEMAVGYATLYGDMCGGFNALKDLYKTQVYGLSEWCNNEKERIPKNIITKAPTAELRENQTDQDSLPSYEILDAILAHMLESRLNQEAIVKNGFKEADVKKIAKLLKLAEYKRFQAPPGIKITRHSFGRDHRYPITHRYYF